MRNPEFYQAFQRGLDSYYEEWQSSKYALVRWEYLQEHGEEVAEQFDAGRARAESDDEL